MKTWIITGGIACGKSFVRGGLESLFPQQVASFSSDDSVQEALRFDQVVMELEVAFGSVVHSASGINRIWLREHVLPIPEKRVLLEAIVHPYVLSALNGARDEAERRGMNLFLAEVPLHYEIGATVSADSVIAVASSRSVQVRRMMKNRGLDEQTVQHFLEAQWPVEAKVERANVVIWNDGSLASLQAQVLTLASPLLQA